mmetsp:Transcript_31826/g.39005  ORF Transcript_31826/g.39005 Transcript_31826/m.39005 type:complete len:151 (-) Transcript_31826:1712-2164(-)
MAITLHLTHPQGLQEPRVEYVQIVLFYFKENDMYECTMSVFEIDAVTSESSLKDSMNLELITPSGVPLFVGSNDVSDFISSTPPSIHSNAFLASLIRSSLPQKSENLFESLSNNFLSLPLLLVKRQLLTILPAAPIRPIRSGIPNRTRYL